MTPSPSIDHSALERLAVSPSGFAFDPESGQSFSINPTGMLALAELRKRRSPEEVASRLASEYDVSPDVALASLEGFLVGLRRLLRW